MARKSDTLRVNRRSFIKASAATGAALATGSVFAPAARAAKTIKLGYVSPQTGPLAAFAEADNFVISSFLESVKGGLKLGSATLPVEVIVKDSQSNPNRAAEVAKELIVSRQDRSDAGRLDAGDHQSGFDAMRDRGGALHLHRRAVAALFHRPPGRTRRRSAGMEALQLHLPLLLGSRGRHRRLHQHVGAGLRPTNPSAVCFPTTATATPGAASRSASRRCSTSSATS